MSRVIALSGWKGSGKDTAAAHLIRNHGYTRLSFADKLKEIVASTYNIPMEYLHSPEKKNIPLAQYPVIPSDPFTETVIRLLGPELRSGFWTPRALCILEGSMKRSVHANYWVRSIVEEIVRNPFKRYVISDMRYQSEADTLKLFVPHRDLMTVRVQRFDTIDTQDPSERNLDEYKFDLMLHNEQDNKEGMYAVLDYIVASMARGE